jgi:hypothetical protein
MFKLPMSAARIEAGQRRLFTRGAIALVAGAAMFGSTAAASPAQAALAPVEQGYQAQARGLGVTLKAGPILLKKYGFKDEHLGLLSVDGKWGICYDYGKKSPDGDWKSGPIADMKPGRDRDRMQWTANARWAEAQKSDKAAMAYKSTINRIRSAEFRSDWAKSYVPQLKAQGKADWVALSDRWLAESAKYAGQPKLTIDRNAPAPGGKGVVVVKLTVNGHPYPGMPVKWTSSGVAVTTVGKLTRKDGTASLAFVRSGGPLSVEAVPTVPEWREAGYTVPSKASIQHLIRGGFSTTLKASTKFDSLAGVSVSQKCDSTCDGKPPVTISAKSNGSPIRWQAVMGGKVMRTLEVASGSGVAKPFTGVDGQDVVLRYSVKVGGKWSAYRYAKTYRVVCPAAPKLTIHAVCDCEGKGLATFTVQAPGGPRSYEVTVAGATKRIGRTASADFQVPVKELARTEVSWSAFDGSKRIGGGELTPWTS